VLGVFIFVVTLFSSIFNELEISYWVCLLGNLEEKLVCNPSIIGRASSERG
jgi:hypothetical protein